MKQLITSLLAIASACSMSSAGLFENDEITIKGIRLGMSIEDALVACQEMVKGTAVEQWADGMSINRSEEDGSAAIMVQTPMGVQLAVISGPGQEGKVTAFTLSGFATNQIFKAAEMDADSFVETFMKAYKIPSMALDETGENYEYKTSGGTLVKIATSKDILLQKVKADSENLENFN
jgi:hypothetical protein